MFSNNCFTWNLSSKFLRWHRLKRIKTTNISGLLHWLERRKKKNTVSKKRERRKRALVVSELAGEEILRSENLHRNQMKLSKVLCNETDCCLLHVGA